MRGEVARLSVTECLCVHVGVHAYVCECVTEYECECVCEGGWVCRNVLHCVCMYTNVCLYQTWFSNKREGLQSFPPRAVAKNLHKESQLNTS